LPVITAGIDLAARPKRTALVTMGWARTRAVIRDVICPADDDVILGAIERAAKTGIDCPFGWPNAFVEFVTAHRTGHIAIPQDNRGDDWRRKLTMRQTDAFVQNTLHAVPLSVSADKIAHVAFRCAVLLARLDAAGRRVDRSGAGPVVEVYPAASLRRWGLYRPGYKDPDKPEVLNCLTDDLLTAAPWLDCGPHEETIRRSHDVFDAVIAALTARAADQGLTFPPSGDDQAAADAEGWIAVPNSPVGQLLLCSLGTRLHAAYECDPIHRRCAVARTR
jgi:predicted nuclease with RNAse H fold